MRLLALIAACGAVAPALAAPSDPELQIIQQRLLQSYMISTNYSGADEDVASFLPLVLPSGQFADINYTGGECKAKGPRWSPAPGGRGAPALHSASSHLVLCALLYAHLTFTDCPHSNKHNFPCLSQFPFRLSGMSTGWGGYTHCQRMQEMASTFFTPNCTHYGNQTLLTSVLRTYYWWLEAMPTDSSNWWFGMIGCGMAVGQLAVQFEDKLSAEQVTNATTLMDVAQWVSFTSTGANAANIGIVHICNGLVNDNKTYVAEAFAKIYSTISYANSEAPMSPEGPKTDGSFMQHGPQLYNGNYGASWAKSSIMLLTLGTNTSLNATAESYDVLTHVILDGCQRMIHYPSLNWDIAVIGRQITNPGNPQAVMSGADGLLLPPSLLRSLGGNRSAELEQFADRLENPHDVPIESRLTGYYDTDYVVSTRPWGMVSLRMISSRTAGGECINGQGLQSLHAADGAMYVYKTGFEYLDIAPTWDWQKLPGTTVQVNGTNLTCNTADGNGYRPMVGVLTDGLHGLSFMDFAALRYGQQLYLRKSYLWQEGVIIIAISNISTAPTSRVTTTFESRLLNGAVQYSTDGKSWQTVPAGTHTFPLPRSEGESAYVLHDGIGYFIPGSASYSPSASLNILNDAVTGNWSAIGSATGTVTSEVFTLWVDHGNPPVEAETLIYHVYPNAGDSASAFAILVQQTITRFTVETNAVEQQSFFDAQSNALYVTAYDNTTTITLPPSLKVPSITSLPYPMGLNLSTYTNTSNGNLTFAINFVYPPDDIITDVNGDSDKVGPVGHECFYYIQTTGSFVECAWPNCMVGHSDLKYTCFSNGTIFYINPPHQYDVDEGILPPFLCAIA